MPILQGFHGFLGSDHGFPTSKLGSDVLMMAVSVGFDLLHGSATTSPTMITHDLALDLGSDVVKLAWASTAV